MKKLLLLFFCQALTIVAASKRMAPFLSSEVQQFQVVKVKGNVTNLTTGKSLLAKSHFSSEDQLAFSSPADRLALIDAAKRTYIARPNADQRTYVLNPIRNKFDTRPGEILSYMQFVKYLDNRDFVILGDQTSIRIVAPELKPTPDRFYFIRYQLKEETVPINKKLKTVGEQIIISKSALFKIEGKAVAMDLAYGFELFYYDAGKEESLKINDIHLIFPDEKSLLTELSLLQAAFGDTSPEKLKQILHNYLLEVYGVPEEENWQAWLLKHFDF